MKFNLVLLCTAARSSAPGSMLETLPLRLLKLDCVHLHPAFCNNIIMKTTPNHHSSAVTQIWSNLEKPWYLITVWFPCFESINQIQFKDNLLRLTVRLYPFDNIFSPDVALCFLMTYSVSPDEHLRWCDVLWGDVGDPQRPGGFWDGVSAGCLSASPGRMVRGSLELINLF